MIDLWRLSWLFFWQSLVVMHIAYSILRNQYLDLDLVALYNHTIDNALFLICSIYETCFPWQIRAKTSSSNSLTSRTHPHRPPSSTGHAHSAPLLHKTPTSNSTALFLKPSTTPPPSSSLASLREHNRPTFRMNHSLTTTLG